MLVINIILIIIFIVYFIGFLLTILSIFLEKKYLIKISKVKVKNYKDIYVLLP